MIKGLMIYLTLMIVTLSVAYIFNFKSNNNEAGLSVTVGDESKKQNIRPLSHNRDIAKSVDLPLMRADSILEEIDPIEEDEVIAKVEEEIITSGLVNYYSEPEEGGNNISEFQVDDVVTHEMLKSEEEYLQNLNSGAETRESADLTLSESNSSSKDSNIDPYSQAPSEIISVEYMEAETEYFRAVASGDVYENPEDLKIN